MELEPVSAVGVRFWKRDFPARGTLIRALGAAGCAHQGECQAEGENGQGKAAAGTIVRNHSVPLL